MTRLVRTILLGALVVAGAGPARADQTPAVGTVAGRVIDQTTAVVPGVTVGLVSGGVEVTTVTGAGRRKISFVGEVGTPTSTMSAGSNVRCFR